MSNRDHISYGKRSGKVVFYSTCRDEWGGSEELWARSIPHLQDEGRQITVFKQKINRRHPEFLKLSEQEVMLRETEPSYSQRIGARLTRLAFSAPGSNYRTGVPATLLTENFYRAIRRLRPELVVIAQAINFDGLLFAFQCLRLHIPYVIITQKAVDFYWPDPKDRDFMRLVWKGARKCFFVSRHNLRLTEEQFGMDIPNSQVISNPVKIEARPVNYPSVSGGYRLACVGRLFVLDKGQDILLRVLAKQKWKDRPLHVTFIGSGVDRDGLISLAEYLRISQVSFIGFQDTHSIWEDYHALILPSRSEGLPLAITEAMAAGRPVVTTSAGGNIEVVQDGITGFISEVNERALDETMERAWDLRDQWPGMGAAASRYIRDHVPALPEKEFVNHINELIYGTP